jgi:hypothetical protein
VGLTDTFSERFRLTAVAAAAASGSPPYTLLKAQVMKQLSVQLSAA